jgi:nitrous oxidase accessory protein NosD
MRLTLTVISRVLVLFLALQPAMFAMSTWYVNGVSGNDGNNCKSPTQPCKTIGHAISLASSGDTVMVASGTYNENLNIAYSLTIIGPAASTTILDGQQRGTVVTISSGDAKVTLANLTIRNGKAAGEEV